MQLPAFLQHYNCVKYALHSIHFEKLTEVCRVSTSGCLPFVIRTKICTMPLDASAVYTF